MCLLRQSPRQSSLSKGSLLYQFGVELNRSVVSAEEEGEREPLQAPGGHSPLTAAQQLSPGSLPTLSSVHLLELPPEQSSVKEDDGEASFFDCESLAGDGED